MQIRLTSGLQEKLCEYQKRVQDQTGFEITITKLVHNLIEKGLEAS